jgi:hypothetical protein
MPQCVCPMHAHCIVLFSYCLQLSSYELLARLAGNFILGDHITSVTMPCYAIVYRFQKGTIGYTCQATASYSIKLLCISDGKITAGLFGVDYLVLEKNRISARCYGRNLEAHQSAHVASYWQCQL